MSLTIVNCISLLAFVQIVASIGESKHRIVGGERANNGEFPHLVSVQTGWPEKHICGGAILNEKWILTAGHCLTYRQEHFVVKAGKHNINAWESSEQKVDVQNLYVHELYHGELKPYDIAMLKLARPLKFNSFVKPISLPMASNSPITGDVILSGWGSISRTENFDMPSVLQKVTLSILSTDQCRSLFTRVSPNSGFAIDDQTNICTEAGREEFSSCGGDSGGPLIRRNAEGENEVVGVSSWSMSPCGKYGMPSVYTKVESYLDWITNIMLHE